MISFHDICEECWDNIENGFAIYGRIKRTESKTTHEKCINIICEHKK